jgi:O6-methylguanine-DNA--protein-cysteine methyltransferase
MPDNTFRDGDPRQIDIDSAAERAYWSKVLGISEGELREIVRALGTSAEAVRRAVAQALGQDEPPLHQ